MPKNNEQYPLGVVMVTVHTTDGTSSLEDWPPEESDEAICYARETAHYTDVKTVYFENAKTGETATFTNPNSN